MPANISWIRTPPTVIRLTLRVLRVDTGRVAVADADVASDAEVRPRGDQDRPLAPQPFEQGDRGDRQIVAQKRYRTGERGDESEDVVVRVDPSLEPGQVPANDGAGALEDRLPPFWLHDDLGETVREIRRRQRQIVVVGAEAGDR